MTENIEEMMKKANDFLLENDNIQEAIELYKQVLVLDPENQNARLSIAGLMMELYVEKKEEETDFDEFDGDSLIEAESIANKVLELLNAITRTDENLHEYDISNQIINFTNQWDIQSLKHGEHSKSNKNNSILVSIINDFPSKIQRQQRKKIKNFLEKIAQFSWEQNNPLFLEWVEFSIKNKLLIVKDKIVDDTAKLLINVNKDVDNKSELGIATKKLKKALKRRKFFRGIKFFFKVIICIIVVAFFWQCTN